MTTLEDIAARLDKIEATLTGQQSAFIRGDQEAAQFMGFKSRSAFKRWAVESGIRPDIRGGLNFWDRAKLIRASR